MTSGNAEFYVKAGVLPAVFVPRGWKMGTAMLDPRKDKPGLACILSKQGRTLGVDDVPKSACGHRPFLMSLALRLPSPSLP